MSIDPARSGYFDIIQNDTVKQQKQGFDFSAKQNVSKTENESDENFWGEDGLSFGDIIDAINPLHHIPVVSEIYSEITGDTKSKGSEMAGKAIYGGPIGFALSFIDNVIEDETGKDMSAHVASIFKGEETPEVASNEEEIIEIAGLPWKESDVQKANNTYKEIQRIDTIELPRINDAAERVVTKYPTFI